MRGIPKWVFAIAAVLITVILFISYFTGKQFSLYPNFGFIESEPPASNQPSEFCHSWITDFARLPTQLSTWNSRIERKINASKPKRGQIHATISTARSNENRTDIHFWWCNDGGGPEWQISETNQSNWETALEVVNGSIPIGFFEGPQGGWSFWYLIPRK